MAKEDVWINLPVKDINKSKDFFDHIGFPANKSGDKVSLIVGSKRVRFMLFPEATFKSFLGNTITTSEPNTNVLFSIGAESKQEVDELLERVKNAGGTIISHPQGKGWMYGAVFSDLDGHRWNVLYMDTSRMSEN